MQVFLGTEGLRRRGEVEVEVEVVSLSTCDATFPCLTVEKFQIFVFQR